MGTRGRTPAAAVFALAGLLACSDAQAQGGVAFERQGVPELLVRDGSGETVFSIRPTGRVYLDAVGADGRVLAPGSSLGGISLDPADDPYPSDDVDLSGGRIGVDGVLLRDIDYEFELDFSGEEWTVTNAYLAYGGDLLPFSVSLGQFKPPTSLAEQTSSRFTTFAERPMFTDAFGFERRLGVGIDRDGENYSLAAGIFRNNVNQDGPEDGLLVAGRATWAPVYNGDTDDIAPTALRAVHLGASAFYRKTGEADEVYDFYGGNVTGPLPTVFGTRPFRGDSDVFLGLEAAMVRGPFSMQAEYGVDLVRADSSLMGDGPAGRADDPVFHGGYLEASYFVTRNAARNYQAGTGDFGRPILAEGASFLDGGWGALEIAGRLDYLNLDSGGLAGGEIVAYGLGVNWWTSRYSRLVVDYFRTEIDGATDVSFGEGLPAGNSVDTLLARVQVDF
ncbi:hypothetical protein GTW51_13480 [Aurantimonas aggregata]|uniref:Porin n=1 Tax=Aurantimonas aggregata TaxID=2047720 RepID=A0A6L9MJB4_9HYPH|nr:porin [Aurantimonas aggregata]NDV87712.1 hypothetical protein [Aurantimonas aggregata]